MPFSLNTLHFILMKKLIISLAIAFVGSMNVYAQSFSYNANDSTIVVKITDKAPTLVQQFNLFSSLIVSREHGERQYFFHHWAIVVSYNEDEREYRFLIDHPEMVGGSEIVYTGRSITEGKKAVKEAIKGSQKLF